MNEDIPMIFQKWNLLNPYKWTKFDSFCWLYNWSKKNNVPFNELEEFLANLPAGNKLCSLKHDYFIEFTHEFGLQIFENLQINITSYFLRDFTEYRGRKILKIWDFLLKLLENENYNPAIIKWLHKDQGIFVLVEPEKVSQLWGKNKGNNHMTYEKMSRAIRYCYVHKILFHLHQKYSYRFSKRILKLNFWKRNL